MKMTYIRLLLLFGAMLMASNAYSLSLQEKQFADAALASAPSAGGGLIANGTTEFSEWFDIRHFHYIDFNVISTAGTGSIQVQYASDKLGASAIDDSTILLFAVGTPATLFGGGMTKTYTRLKIDCDAGPNCTIDGWFVAKGGNYR